jgi:hypothetical protein
VSELLVIGDDNWQDHCDGGKHAAGSFGCVRTPGRMRAMPEMTLENSGSPLVPQSDWKSRAEKMVAAKATLKDLAYDTRALDQDGVGQCWLFGNCGAVRTLSIRQGGIARLPSPQSLAYALRSDYARWGVNGGDPADSAEALVKFGAARAELWTDDPAEGRDSKLATDAAEADRENNRVTRCVELGHENDRWDEVVSCALQNIPMGVCFDWWSHHVEGVGVIVKGGELCLLCRNSWGADYGDNGFFALAGRKKYPSGAWAFVEATYSP